MTNLLSITTCYKYNEMIKSGLSQTVAEGVATFSDRALSINNKKNNPNYMIELLLKTYL